MNRGGNLFAAVAGAGLVHNMGGIAQLIDGQAPPNPAPPDTSELADALPHVPLRRIPRYARMALLAAIRALDDAGWRQNPGLNDMALVIGTAYSGVAMSMDFMDSAINEGPRLSSPTAFSHAVNNMGAGLLSLLLQVQGPCLTISQFELSFAGAVCAATTWLHAGRARRALVGAVDETDERFTRCCPRLRAAGIPLTEGAVFLCLEAPDPARPSIGVRWEQAGEDPGGRHAHRYGHGPLAQALDTLLALHSIQSGLADQADCLCARADGRRAAIIEIRSSHEILAP